MGNKEKWEETVQERLKQAAGSLPIPEKLEPGQMETWLRGKIDARAQTKQGQAEQQAGQKGGGVMKGRKKEGGNKRNSYLRWWGGTAAVAASLAVVLFAAGRSIDWGQELGGIEEAAEGQGYAMGQTEEHAAKGTAQTDGEVEEGTTYAQLYQAFSKVWKQQEEIELHQEARSSDTESAGAESGAQEFSMEENGVAEGTGGAMKESSSEGAGSYGKTNQQEETVDEADIIKNDGRYLYQIINQEKSRKHSIQITDTKGKLQKAAVFGEFDNEISNMYVWGDTLVAIESGWLNDTAEGGGGGINPLDGIRDFMEDVFTGEDGDGYRETAYSKIHIYNIKDRSKPKESHAFTIKGSYQDSRISDGYLYFFSMCNAYRPKLEKDYQAYIPEFDGKPLSPDKIYLPQGADTASYLVMASINMEQPDKFADTKAIVTAADKFYVSQANIYVADSEYVDGGTQGEQCDSTRIYRFSYQDGKMKKEAEGIVDGTLKDDMAMNEYKGHLRMVTTVEKQEVKEVKDDITGEVIGYDSLNFETYNNLYVLDEGLQAVGKIEKLAVDERIYSARFMGDAGYFVTFRQTDPLFSVDLSDPKEPKVLGELKISGFSEYLHFYNKGLLLGLGMEADEETGVTEGMKLSMFDISDPSNVKEKSKRLLEGYDYSEALYNYKAVLIDTEKNLFGFYAEGYQEEPKYHYLLFTFEGGKFKEVLNIDCSGQGIYSYGQVRGTYIGERFYLLASNGRVEEYSLADGSKSGELAP